jgi:2-hydroxycarboxylate transporter family
MMRAALHHLFFAVIKAKSPTRGGAQRWSRPDLRELFRQCYAAAYGRRLGMYQIEAAIVNATHSGQGGTGDIAILTAANRMQLMPFAQIATRIGGAITVTVTLILLAQVG